jgi:hypothetical protein
MAMNVQTPGPDWRPRFFNWLAVVVLLSLGVLM